jgi:hypothetical protein
VGWSKRLLCGVLVLCAACGASTQAQAKFKLRATGLDPGFRAQIRDYVVPCAAPTRVFAATPGNPNAKARIGRGRWFGGAKARSVQLTPGQAIKVSTRSGGRRPRRAFLIRCLPADFPAFEFTRHATPAHELYMVSPISPAFGDNYTFILSSHGVPVWWMKTAPPSIDAKVLSDGTIAWAVCCARTYLAEEGISYQLRTVDGTLVRTLRTVGTFTDHHELVETPGGNFMILSYRPRAGVDLTACNGDADATVLDGVVQEITPDGALVREWSTEDHVDIAETGRWCSEMTAEPYDIVHINAVEPLPGGDFMISLRHTDAVYGVNGATGDIVWKLGGTPTPDSLAVTGDEYPTPLGGQHDPRWLGNGEISVYDNETDTGRAPRAVRFRLDGSTATLVHSQRDPAAPSSFCCGSARYSENGSLLVSWGGRNQVREYSVSGGLTFALDLAPGEFSYRAVAVDEFSTESVRHGMRAQHPNAH